MAVALALLLAAGVRIAGADGAGPRVQAQLVSELATIEPGGSFWVALRQVIAPRWHTYWENPGDSGEPATIDWSLPAGFEAGPIAWPHPERIPIGPFMSYGYEGEVLLLTRMKAPADLAPGRAVTLRARAGWLVCEKECIPEEAAVELTLQVGPRAARDSRWADAFARAIRAVPMPSPWPAEFTATAAEIEITVAAPGLAADRVADIWFYPREWGVIDHVGLQRAVVLRDGIRLAVARGALSRTAEQPIEGVLVVKERIDGSVTTQAFAIRAVPAGPARLGAGSALALAQAAGLALLGGVLLNLMPCVLPVLSVKALSLVQHAGAAPWVARAHGLAYTAGILVSFGALAGVLIALRSAGEQIGWGFQLQSPIVVAVLAYLLFAMGLSLSGVMTIGGRIAGVGSGLARRPGYAGSFFTGALATVAATPCTAPFMGAAVGFAMTRPVGEALAVFEALGLGLALPYLALSFVPAHHLLPRPGPWMERLKQFLAFPLYASVAWLVWVLSQQVGPAGVAAALAGLVLIAFGAWLHEVSRGAAPRWRRAATAMAALAVVAAVVAGQVGASAGPRAPGPGVARETEPEAFSPARLAELRAQGVPVFVNFTAAWCITCLVNERVALRSPAVAEALAGQGIAYLKADWTRRDPEITRILESFGRSGVPLYVLYPPARGTGAGSGEPAVLPAVLTEGVVLDAIARIRSSAVQ
ncbi:MAG TPA: thioredoxin family protein [Candidatus Binatia bacterium]|nr:thioredoxin family protein [Candidatus Binatia bacterium]